VRQRTQKRKACPEKGLRLRNGHVLTAVDDSDSDNLIRDNEIQRSREAGIHFRGGNKAFAPHRNRFEGNRIVDSGGEKGIAIDINGETEAVTIVKNEIRETRQPMSRIGIWVGAEAKDIHYEKNRIEGFATDISDLRKR
jgi:nitrous oxidase accessory protein NosD